MVSEGHPNPALFILCQYTKSQRSLRSQRPRMHECYSGGLVKHTHSRRQKTEGMDHLIRRDKARLEESLDTCVMTLRHFVS